MALTKEEKNRGEISNFLKNNDIDPNTAMGFDNKFQTEYYVGERRKFAEETRIGFNIIGASDTNISLHEINYIEFETTFKIAEQTFHYDETRETLTITGNDSDKHNGEYKIVIHSIYPDL